MTTGKKATARKTGKTADKAAFNGGLLEFIERSPTPFHAVQTMRSLLCSAGFEVLDESAEWSLQAGGKYLVERNGSSIIAFIVGEQEILETGVHMVGAHTDSPCLKVKPNADVYRHGFHQLGLEVYGGVLLNPWFDRDLSMAGRVTCKSKNGQLQHCLVDFKRAVATIPNLAIHLDREANSKRCVNQQTDLPAILSILDSKAKEDSESFKSILLDHIKKNKLLKACESVVEYEISLYDTQAPALIGLHEEFISSARLDNLLSCYTGLQALLRADTQQSSLLVCNDHEEVGSASMAGASGPMLRDCLIRMCGSEQALIRVMQQSMMISADNAHGLHPNFAQKHDAQHGPLINGGVVIKTNANQRYASNSETSARFRMYAELVNAPVQSFVVRSDMACGSTIGPITATELGVPTVDIGVPTFAMHSIRELAGSDDAWQLGDILTAFYTQPRS